MPRPAARRPISIFPFVDDFLGNAQAKNGSRRPGVKQELDEYTLDLLRGNAHGQPGAYLVLHAKVVAVDTLGGDGGEAA